MQSCRKPQSFHRFILSDNVNQISIRIPNKFTREHRKTILLDNVSINVSGDKVWSLGWMISGDGKLCLQQGWPEFAEHYRLKAGHLLLFDYLGNSKFHVRIFDRSSCEISYSPSVFQEIEEPATEDDQTIAMSETEFLDTTPHFFHEIKASGKGYEQRSRNRTMAMSETEVLNTPTIVQEIEGSRKGYEQRSRNRVPDSVKSFKSKYPFYSVKIKDTYVSWGLYVPVKFLRRYLLSGDEKCGICVLRMADGRSWGPVKCRDYESYGKLHGCNWNRFRDDNHLGVGDVCVVEMINEMEKVLKLTIFRAR